MTSDERAFERLVEQLKQKVEVELNDRLPRKVGVIAVQHFRQNFRDSGFMDGGLKPWQKSKRELSGKKDASSRYKTLTSARNHLMSSTQAVAGRAQVSIENPVPYAQLHNEGGSLSTNPTITPQMRKFAWAMVYKLSGKRRGKGGKGKKRRKTKKKEAPLSEEAQKWKALALTKKKRLNIKVKMPKRQFMGESKELTEKVNKEIMNAIEKIKDGISTL